jgi:hypothetical protein
MICDLFSLLKVVLTFLDVHCTCMHAERRVQIYLLRAVGREMMRIQILVKRILSTQIVFNNDKSLWLCAINHPPVPLESKPCSCTRT